MNKSSALKRFNTKVILGLIDYGFKDELQLMIENVKKKNLEIPKGQSVCQLLILPSKVPILMNEKLISKTERGGFGSTGQEFIKLSDIKNKRFRKQANKKRINISLEKQQNPENKDG
jgi:hypothetical protein